MLLGITLILIGVYAGLLGLMGVRTEGKEIFVVIIGGIISLGGFFAKE